MSTIPLPPYLRRIQQSWLWQMVALPFLVVFVGFLVAQGCLSNGVFHIGEHCFETALTATLLSIAANFISGHSVGSKEFNPDGTSNKAVAKVATMPESDKTSSLTN